MAEERDFEDAFPALSEEMDTGRTKQYKIDGVRTLSEDAESAPKDPFTPTVVDYIRRCDTVKQAIEIVEYLLKQGEISTGQAREIKKQLKANGVRSFGAKKESGHYLRQGIEE
jgi:hypothetical protein